MTKIASYKLVIRDRKKVVEREEDMTYELASHLAAVVEPVTTSSAFNPR